MLSCPFAPIDLFRRLQAPNLTSLSLNYQEVNLKFRIGELSFLTGLKTLELGTAAFHEEGVQTILNFTQLEVLKFPGVRFEEILVGPKKKVKTEEIILPLVQLPRLETLVIVPKVAEKFWSAYFRYHRK